VHRASEYSPLASLRAGSRSARARASAFAASAASSSHASFYNQGGSGLEDNCLPWEEYRNNSSDAHMDSWANLVSLEGTAEPWMNADRAGGFLWGSNGVSTHPTTSGPTCAMGACNWTWDVPTWWHTQRKKIARRCGNNRPLQ
jgi:hypothetical protein